MNKRVLVVDDEPTVQKTVEKILESGGLDVTSVGSGVECIEAVRAGFRGLILMDVQMPDMDGWQTIKKLKKEKLTEGILISMLTGKEIPDEEMNKYKELVFDYITKPFDRDQLVHIVKTQLSFL